MSAHAPSGNSAPYKLLGVYGQPMETTIDFHAAEPAHGDDPLRRQMVFVADHGDAGDRSTCRIDVIAAWNCFLPCAAGDADCEVFRREVCAPGSGDDDPAGGGAAAQSEPDAD